MGVCACCVFDKSTILSFILGMKKILSKGVSCFSLAILICHFTVFVAQAQENKSDSITNIDFSTALRHVYESNPSLYAAREELKETKELYPQARAGWLPNISAETSIFTTDIDNSNFGAVDGTTTKDITLGVTQPIFSGGKTFAAVDRSHHLIRAGERILNQVEQDLVLKTAMVYANLLCDTRILKLRQRNEKSLKNELAAAQDKYNFGENTVTDVHQAQVRYQRAMSDTYYATGQKQASEAAFVEIVGHAPLSLASFNATFHFSQDLELMVQIAQRNNPDIDIAQYRHEASKKQIDVVLREMFPQISAFASYNKQYDPQPGLIDRSENKTIGLQATLALYEGGATRSRVRESRYAANRQKYQIEEIKRRIRQEVTSNWRMYQASQAQLASREKEIEAAELALEGVREESRMGQRTVLDILDADQEVTNAGISLAKTHRDNMIAKFQLAASLGILGLDQVHYSLPAQYNP